MKNKDELIHMIDLAKLSLELEDVDSMFISVSENMNIINQICEVDLSQYDCSEEIETFKPREDIVEQSIPVDLLLSGTEQIHDNFFAI